MRRLLPAMLLLALAAGGCSYESSGTSSTTLADPGDVVPATGPADIVFEDQMVEGSAVVVGSVTLPTQGFVVLQSDAAGSPGEVIGVSNPIGLGTVAGVVVPFFFPLEAGALVHATLHVDMDGDGEYLYEPPDDIVDLPATFANGEAATATAAVSLLAPVSPGSITMADQRTGGASVVVAEVVLPAGGFVALHASQDGVPGPILALSDLLPEGTSEEVVVAFDEPLGASQQLFAVAYVDRDGDGVAGLTSPDSPDDVALGPDGGPVRAAAEITVVLVAPTELEVGDQEGDGTMVTVASVSLPSAGFLELRADRAGAPGALLLVSDLLPAGTSTGLDLELDTPLTADAVLWVRVRIDFDGGGVLDEDDPLGLTEEGETARASLAYTFVEGND